MRRIGPFPIRFLVALPDGSVSTPTQGQTQELLYESTDCSGTAYIPPPGDGVTGAFTAPDGHTVSYPGAPTMKTLASLRSPLPPHACVADTPHAASVSPIVPLDLAALGFAAPFRVDGP